MVHVLTNIKRPPAEIVEAFRGQASATIHEASGRKGYIASEIRQIAKGVKICGPAFTVQCAAGDNMMLHKALERAKPGDVLVVTVGGACEYGYFGGLMATSAVARKLGGMVIEGCIRDSEEIINMGFPIFARGFSIRGTGKGGLGLINYPTVFGGLTISPGDLIVGDDDGLVCIKRDELSSVLDKTIARVRSEETKAEALAGGISSVVYNKFDKLFEECGLVEEIEIEG